MGMHELFEVRESGAEWTWAWMKAIASAAAVAVGIFMAFDAADALSSSTPGFLAAQWGRHAVGARLEGEAEAEALLDLASREAELPGIARARVWASDKLSASGVNGMFSFVFYKITLGESFARAAGYDQRWLVFHEAGHAVQLLTTRYEPAALPEWGLSPAAAKAMRSSLLYRQAYAESFADLFALSMALRLDPADRRAASELSLALAPGVHNVSIAHDTQAALALGSRRLGELAKLRGPSLLALIDVLASRGAALTVGDWGAEREALCLEGFWGFSRWARDAGHEVASNPWSMASGASAAADEPRGAELAQLMALSPRRGWKRERVQSRDWPAYSRRAAALASNGDAPQGSGVPPERSMSWGSALADYESKARNPARGVLERPFAWIAMAVEAPRPEGCAGPASAGHGVQSAAR